MKSPSSKAPTPKPKRLVARRPQLERDTPLVALAAARTVIEEAEQRLRHPLPPSFATRLAHRACRIYVHDPRFRKRLRASGNEGRDTLYAFMEHWLDDMLERFK